MIFQLLYCIQHLVNVKFIHLHLLSNFQPKNTIPSAVTRVVASCGLGLHLLLAAAVRQYLGWLGAAVDFQIKKIQVRKHGLYII